MARKNNPRVIIAPPWWYTEIFKPLMHLSAAVQFAYAVYYYYTCVQFSISAAHLDDFLRGAFRSLSFINGIIQSIYYTCAFLNDIIGTNELIPKGDPPAIRKIADYLMASLAFPIAFNVGIIFWLLYAYDRELIHPRSLDEVYPGWLGTMLHTDVMLFIIVEMFCTFRTYPKRGHGIVLLGIFIAGFSIWIYVLNNYYSGRRHLLLGVVHFATLFFVQMFTFSLYVFGEDLNYLFWGAALELASKRIPE